MIHSLEVLQYEPAGPDVQMTYFAVSHLAGGKSYGFTRCSQCRAGVRGLEMIHSRRIRHHNGVTIGGCTGPPPVENCQQEWSWDRQVNLTMRAKTSGFKLAPPTRAPSISGSAISSAMLSGVTLPPY